MAYCFLTRIVMFYNDWGRSQYVSLVGAGEAKPSILPQEERMDCCSVRCAPRNGGIRLKHLVHVDHDSVGMAGGGADEDVLHQPTVLRVPGLKPRHGAEIDQFRVDRLPGPWVFQNTPPPHT